MRRQFSLPLFDVEFLDEKNLPWETIIERGLNWVLLPEYPIAAGYNHDEVSLALQLGPSYPETQIDMVYFHPHLSSVPGRPIGRVNNYSLDGSNWQRWSRHRTSANPWRPNRDSIETHALLIDEWLEREMREAA